jgi:Zn-dependent peptidase ImmA (M78 family)
LSYDPGADAAARYPDWVIRRRNLGWGITEVLCRKSRVILLERGTDAARRRCSLAHAIAHLDLGHGAAMTARFERRQEAEATQLAARRLRPLDDLVWAVQWTHDLEEAAVELEVDMDTLQTRMEHLHPSELMRLRMTRRRLEESA